MLGVAQPFGLATPPFIIEPNFHQGQSEKALRHAESFYFTRIYKVQL